MKVNGKMACSRIRVSLIPCAGGALSTNQKLF
jgi:hypothetical protein